MTRVDKPSAKSAPAATPKPTVPIPVLGRVTGTDTVVVVSGIVDVVGTVVVVSPIVVVV